MAVDLEISLQCSACGVIVPLNAFTAEVTCWSCERRTTLDDVAWHRLLDEPLCASPVANVEHAMTLETEIGVFRRTYRNGAPSCHACRGALDEDSLRTRAITHGSETGATCSTCGALVRARVAPPMLASVGVIALVGETEGRPAMAPITLACTSCGGNLAVDGTSRVIACAYCGATQVLPDDLFLRLRSMPIRRWALLLRATSTSPTAAPLASWSSVYDVVADERGNIYAWGDSGRVKSRQEIAQEEAAIARDEPLRGGTLWSMAPDMTLRWMRDGLLFNTFDTKLAIAPSGHLMVWDDRAAHTVRREDGASVVCYSGKPGEAGPLETRGGSLVVDADGTILVRTKDSRLVRYDAEGRPTATWHKEPAAVSTAGMFSRVFRRRVATGDLVSVPPELVAMIQYATLSIGWDQRLYLRDIFRVACLDHTGRPLWTAPLEEGGLRIGNARVAADSFGRAYAAARSDDRITIHRVDPSMGPPSERTAHVRRELPKPNAWIGPLGGAAWRMTCTPDGTVFLVGNEGRVRRYGADGRLEFASPATAADDAASALLP